MARLRVVRSLALRVLCSASDSAAFRATVSSSAFLSPRRGTRRLTRLPRRPPSHSSMAGASGGSTGTSTCRGTVTPPPPPGGRAAARRCPAAVGAVRGADCLPRVVGDARSDLVLAVYLAEELPDQVPGRDVLHLVDHPAALPAHPAVAHVEDLDRRLKLILGQRDHVAVGAGAEHH